MNEELNRLKSEKEQIQIIGSVHVDCAWDIRIWGTKSTLMFLFTDRLVGELVKKK
jgi:hypothetical protein